MNDFKGNDLQKIKHINNLLNYIISISKSMNEELGVYIDSEDFIIDFEYVKAQLVYVNSDYDKPHVFNEGVLVNKI